ncbi:hypothetical protein BHE74_00010421 [Ensete ventricosum]|nr:hypothetical protein GW17_00059605 [Ensete ventricosum]RWW81202.1 hypothetical protein BHE74_00010421 [Ensete ventricosum]RZR82028.1 hypothetical protein BHM03_00008368 [Ensete ventricosum]
MSKITPEVTNRAEMEKVEKDGTRYLDAATSNGMHSQIEVADDVLPKYPIVLLQNILEFVGVNDVIMISYANPNASPKCSKEQCRWISYLKDVGAGSTKECSGRADKPLAAR